MTWSSIALRFVRGQEGASIVEYALVLVLITIVSFAATAALGTQIAAFFSSMSTTI